MSSLPSTKPNYSRTSSPDRKKKHENNRIESQGHELENLNKYGWTKNALSEAYDIDSEDEEKKETTTTTTPSSTSLPTNQVENYEEKKQALAQHKQHIKNNIVKLLKENILNRLMCQDILKAMDEIAGMMFSQEKKSTTVFSKIDEIYSTLYFTLCIQFELQDQKKSQEFMATFVSQLLACVFHLCVHSSGIGKNKTQSDYTSNTNSFRIIHENFSNHKSEEYVPCHNPPQLLPDIPEILNHISMGKGAENKTLHEITEHILNFKFNFQEALENKIRNLTQNQSTLLSTDSEKELNLRLMKQSDDNTTIIAFLNNEKNIVPGFIKVIFDNPKGKLKSFIAYSDGNNLQKNKPRTFEYIDKGEVRLEKIESIEGNEFYFITVSNPSLNFDQKFETLQKKLTKINIILLANDENKKQVKTILSSLENYSLCSENLFDLKISFMGSEKNITPISFQALELHFDSSYSYSKFIFMRNGNFFATPTNSKKTEFFNYMFKDLDKLQAINAFVRFVEFTPENLFSVTLPSTAKTNIDIGQEKITLELAHLETKFLQFLMDSQKSESSSQVQDLEFKLEFQKHQLKGYKKEYQQIGTLASVELNKTQIPELKTVHIYFTPKAEAPLGGVKVLDLVPHLFPCLKFYDGQEIPFFPLGSDFNIPNDCLNFDNSPLSNPKSLSSDQIFYIHVPSANLPKNDLLFLVPLQNKIFSLNEGFLIGKLYIKDDYGFKILMKLIDKDGHPLPTQEIKIAVFHSTKVTNGFLNILGDIRIIYNSTQKQCLAIQTPPENRVPDMLDYKEFFVTYDKETRTFVCHNHDKFKNI